ncbi:MULTISPECIES: GHKL domain-containing protein [unclassified Breznakia]|uniref:sensor histidine kinase n=1 Tax=unclassified Breznakia TaxID=2623764 RepID=UPI002477206C|nr:MULTISPECIES: GHKL domain-containing protein [unclassified Breznakia]MDH6365881.1 two-component system sensor histidine kinase AgrC [Breznakia sp. PH1-1]MDH6403187.1 two-component system sensor histidine kinase AgrC [Breznakia sp. PF1-11]MDH6410896.1 two-component system sensor histidine kinase AgrC [Breznakia sp. PFB1-11]MDH6413047.1 two-component system sensor histidine kinase AgrC [Breznakia sp. PFB1-14]MDH6415415.1 two-component system sensor histidine kinase AgrC [Breznakia sp. PFB1-4]
MTFDMFSYVHGIIILMIGVLLSFYPVRKELVVSLSNVLVTSFMASCIFALISALADGYVFNLLLPIFLVCGLLYHHHVLQVSIYKSAFVVALATNVFVLLALLSDGLIAFAYGFTSMANLNYDTIMMIWSTFCMIVGGFIAQFVLSNFVYSTIEKLQLTNWKTYWLLPTVFTIAITSIGFTSIARPIIFTLYMCVMAVVEAVTISVLFHLIEVNVDTAQTISKLQGEKKHLEILHDEYETIRRYFEKSQQLRHDQKHQYRLMHTLLQQGAYDELNGYISNLSESIATSDHVRFTNNINLNAILNFYYDVANHANIQIRLAIDLPSEITTVQDSDLCIVVGNLLENAIESCSDITDATSIKLHMCITRQNLVITMDNSCHSSHIHKYENTYISSKVDAPSGIGLSSISTIVSSYNGYCKFSNDLEQFYSSIVIPLTDA